MPKKCADAADLAHDAVTPRKHFEARAQPPSISCARSKSASSAYARSVATPAAIASGWPLNVWPLGSARCVEVRRERFAHCYSAEGHVRRRHAFGKREDIGRNVEALRGKGRSRYARTRSSPRRRSADSEAVAKLAQAWKIGWRIENDAVAADNRLDQQRRDVLRAFVADNRLEMLDGAIGLFTRVARVKRTAIRKGREEAYDARNAGLVRPTAVLTGQRSGAGSRSVKRAIRG